MQICYHVDMAPTSSRSAMQLSRAAATFSSSPLSMSTSWKYRAASCKSSDSVTLYHFGNFLLSGPLHTHQMLPFWHFVCLSRSQAGICRHIVLNQPQCYGYSDGSLPPRAGELFWMRDLAAACQDHREQRRSSAEWPGCVGPFQAQPHTLPLQPHTAHRLPARHLYHQQCEQECSFKIV